MSSARHEVLKTWIAAILWLIVIAIESSALLSAHYTSRILFPILHYLFGLDYPHFQHWHFYIRKGGHVLGYAILSVLLFRAWRASLPVIRALQWSWQWTTLAMIGTIFVASLDEWHQSYLPSRTGRWQDVVIDTFGGTCAQIILFLLAKRAEPSN